MNSNHNDSNRNDSNRYACPVELALDFLRGKWKPSILHELKLGPKRFGELRAAIAGISDKMLAQRLRELEALGLVERVEGSPRDYRLTQRGTDARPALNLLYAWGKGVGVEIQATYS